MAIKETYRIINPQDQADLTDQINREFLKLMVRLDGIDRSLGTSSTSSSDSSGTWVDDAYNWVRVTDTMFRVSGDARARFGVGTKLKWVQGGVARYGYVSAAPTYLVETVVPIVGHTMTNGLSVSSPQYSYHNPPDFPWWFDLAPVWGGFSTPPSGGQVSYNIEGRFVRLGVFPQTLGVSNSTSCSINIPVQAKTLTGLAFSGFGIAVDAGGPAVTDSEFAVYSGGTTAELWFNGSATGWTDSGNKFWKGFILYEI